VRQGTPSCGHEHEINFTYQLTPLSLHVAAAAVAVTRRRTAGTAFADALDTVTLDGEERLERLQRLERAGRH
jgi:hypothetical protein